MSGILFFIFASCESLKHPLYKLIKIDTSYQSKQQDIILDEKVKAGAEMRELIHNIG